jgi:hypothetical protein
LACSNKKVFLWTKKHGLKLHLNGLNPATIPVSVSNLARVVQEKNNQSVTPGPRLACYNKKAVMRHKKHEKNYLVEASP